MGDSKIHYRCPSCGAINRLPVARLTQSPRCGSCKQGLDPAKPQAASPATFGKLVLESDLPVLVDFWAPWCGPCRMVAPALETLAREMVGRLQVVKVNSDEAQALAQQYRVSGIPSLLMFSGGREVGRKVGALPLPQLRAFAQGYVRN